MRPSKTDPRRETIGEWEYFRDVKGNLYRGRADQPIETRPVEFIAPASHAEFALRSVRLAAGLPEWRNGEALPPNRSGPK
jgi:hypothetical protein